MDTPRLHSLPDSGTRWVEDGLTVPSPGPVSRRLGHLDPLM